VRVWSCVSDDEHFEASHRSEGGGNEKDVVSALRQAVSDDGGVGRAFVGARRVRDAVPVRRDDV
jgi:hypothetical protein